MADPLADCENRIAGDLTVDGLAMNNPGFTVENLWELWKASTQRGDPLIRPGVIGVKPRKRRRITGTPAELVLDVTGWYLWDGTAQSNAFIGLQKNIDYITTFIVNPISTGDGTRPLVLTMPDGSVRTGPALITGMDMDDVHPKARRATVVVEMILTEGRLSA